MMDMLTPKAYNLGSRKGIAVEAAVTGKNFIYQCLITLPYIGLAVACNCRFEENTSEELPLFSFLARFSAELWLHLRMSGVQYGTALQWRNL